MVFTAVLDGQTFVPQHRERIFIIGFDSRIYGCLIDFDFAIEYPNCRSRLRDILESEVDDKYTLSDKLWTYLQNYAAKHRAKGNGFGCGLTEPDGITRTLSARYYKDGSEILIRQDKKNPRRLTPRECARLQGFPESYRIIVSDAGAYRQFGNSVVVPLVQSIAAKLVTTMNSCDSEVNRS